MGRIKQKNAFSFPWYPFDKSKGSSQKRPPERKWVIVRLPKVTEFVPDAIAAGYLKNAAGDKQSPYFVVPGIGGDPSAWCDCLPSDFEYPVFSEENDANLEPQNHKTTQDG